MINKQGGQVLPVLLTIVALLIAGTGFYLSNYKKTEVSPIVNIPDTKDQGASDTLPVTTGSPKTEPASDTSTTGWKTYTSKEFGISFKYPNEATLEEGPFNQSSHGILMTVPISNKSSMWLHKDMYAVISPLSSLKKSKNCIEDFRLSNSTDKAEKLEGSGYYLIGNRSLDNNKTISGSMSVGKDYLFETGSNCYAFGWEIIGDSHKPTKEDSAFIETESQVLEKMVSTITF